MSGKLVNGVPVEAIVSPFEDEPELVERIAFRKVKGPKIAIVEPDPIWLEHFQTFRSRILAAFDQDEPEIEGHQEDNGDKVGRVTVLAINHVGSTSVPDLPAKPVVDIDLVLSSSARSAEPFFVPRLEAAGFQYLLLEPGWHWHRFFVASEPMSCNLHVWGPQSPEVERHRIFGDWLREHDDDRELYARTKRESAAISHEKGDTVVEYNYRKQDVIRGILTRAFTALGYMSE